MENNKANLLTAIIGARWKATSCQSLFLESMHYINIPTKINLQSWCTFSSGFYDGGGWSATLKAKLLMVIMGKKIGSLQFLSDVTFFKKEIVLFEQVLWHWILRRRNRGCHLTQHILHVFNLIFWWQVLLWVCNNNKKKSLLAVFFRCLGSSYKNTLFFLVSKESLSSSNAFIKRVLLLFQYFTTLLLFWQTSNDGELKRICFLNCYASNFKICSQNKWMLPEMIN